MTHFKKHENQITRIVDRVEYICETIKNKTVLDIGCASAPSMAKLIAQGKLPHINYAKSAKSIIGIDIDENCMKLKSITDGEYFVHNYETGRLQFNVDWIVASEILEHVGNPQTFLQNLRDSVSTGTRILVTVPNSTCYNAIKNSKREIEQVHQDHLAVYSPATIRQLLERCGWTVKKILGTWPDGKLPKSATMQQCMTVICISEKT